jgi:hypothetical protein
MYVPFAVSDDRNVASAQEGEVAEHRYRAAAVAKVAHGLR